MQAFEDLKKCKKAAKQVAKQLRDPMGQFMKGLVLTHLEKAIKKAAMEFEEAIAVYIYGADNGAGYRPVHGAYGAGCGAGSGLDYGGCSGAGSVGLM